MALVSGPGRAGGTSDLELHTLKHVAYIQKLDTRKDELEYWLTEHLRLNGVYWGLTALHLLGHPDALPREDTIDFVLSCQRDNGGFGAAPGHDAHMLYTVSAVQILVILDAVDELEKRGHGGKEKVGSCMMPPVALPYSLPILNSDSHCKSTGSRNRRVQGRRVG